MHNSLLWHWRKSYYSARNLQFITMYVTDRFEIITAVHFLYLESSIFMLIIAL